MASTRASDKRAADKRKAAAKIKNEEDAKTKAVKTKRKAPSTNEKVGRPKDQVNKKVGKTKEMKRTWLRIARHATEALNFLDNPSDWKIPRELQDQRWCASEEIKAMIIIAQQ